MNRNQIIQNFPPFNKHRSIDSMLIGNDLDALLSAQYLYDHFGWKIIGLYDLRNIYHDESIDIRQKIREKKIVAIDLDIYHRTIPSVGHHILQLNSKDILTGFSNSINPNLLRNRTKQNYRWKYPLGTIHFLRWLFDDMKRNDDFEMLCWLADSSYINAQKYRENVEEWLRNFLTCNYLTQSFNHTDTIEFERNLKERILPTLYRIKLDNVTAMTESKHLKIRGYQTRIRNVNTDTAAIQKLLNHISNLSGMQTPLWPKKFRKIPGTRTNTNLKEVLKKYKNFDDFLLKENIFSYALTYKNTINYTKFEKK